MKMQDKKEFYQSLVKQVDAITAGEPDLVANLANTAAVLYHTLEDVNWAGFYLIKDGQLVLGPFQGQAACIRIDIGKGVCGTAVSTQTTQLVEDVHQFEGHIACDAASQSEIVVPIFKQNQVVGVLDIDAPILSRFDAVDKAGVESLVRIVERFF